MSSSELSGMKIPRPVYFSRFTLVDYLRTNTSKTPLSPPEPTRKDFMKAASKLRVTAQPFFPHLELNPAAEEFRPRVSLEEGGVGSSVVVRSLLEDEVEVRVPVDPVSPVISLTDLQKYFPLAKGLLFLSDEDTDQRRLISVIKSCNFNHMQNSKIIIGDVKFLLPLEFDRTYYVTEKIPENESFSAAADTVRQVREVVGMLEENITNMSHIRHTLKVLETRATEQMFAATLDESGFEDFDPDNNGD